MIYVEVKRENQEICSFKVSGHALYEDEGLDIVCAGVAAVVYGALGALQELCNLTVYEDVNNGDENDYIRFQLPGDIEQSVRDKAVIILETMLIGLKQIRMAYDEAFGEYVSIYEQEVQP